MNLRFSAGLTLCTSQCVDIGSDNFMTLLLAADVYLIHQSQDVKLSWPQGWTWVHVQGIPCEQYQIIRPALTPVKIPISLNSQLVGSLSCRGVSHTLGEAASENHTYSSVWSLRARRGTGSAVRDHWAASLANKLSCSKRLHFLLTILSYNAAKLSPVFHPA